MAGVAQAGRSGGLEVDVADQQLLAELRGARDRLAGVVDDEGVTVEDELVLAADERAEGDAREVVARTLREHPLALHALAGVVGRGGDVQQQRRAGDGLVAGRRARLPDVLADGQSDGLLADLEHRAAIARLEVALLVEDAVVGEEDLAIDRMHDAVGEHGGGVVDVGRALGKADDGNDPVGLRCELVQRRAGGCQEALAQQQILGRVAGQRQLGKQHDIGAGLQRLLAPGANQRSVAGDVADGGVHLAEGQAHLSWRWRRAWPRHCRRPLCACVERLSRRLSWRCVSPAG